MTEETSEGKSSPNLDMLANVYIKIRDARTALKTEFTTRTMFYKSRWTC
jgi:hypothetical protein